MLFWKWKPQMNADERGYYRLTAAHFSIIFTPKLKSPTKQLHNFYSFKVGGASHSTDATVFHRKIQIGSLKY